MKIISICLSFFSLYLTQEHPPLVCISSNSTLCDTICAVRYNGQKNTYDIEQQECVSCSSDQCDGNQPQSQNNLEFPGLVDDPEISCVNGDFFQEYGQCICARGWFDSGNYDSQSKILYKCDTQLDPYQESQSSRSSTTLSSAFFYVLASLAGGILGLVFIFCVTRLSRMSTYSKESENFFSKENNTLERENSVEEAGL